jgi:hypothetical protein
MTRRTRNWCGGFSFVGNGYRTNVRARAMKSFAELTGRKKTIKRCAGSPFCRQQCCVG